MRRSAEQLTLELAEAAKIIKVGSIYWHYKSPKKHYRVLNLAVQEATDKICVVYQALYPPNIIFVRDLDIWLEQVELDGVKVNRFRETE